MATGKKSAGQLSIFSAQDFENRCNKLAAKEPVFKGIIQQYGYPPLWTREASFATLVHIILEQQVSLASALAAFSKLTEKLGAVTPAGLLALSDEDMKACYFSRQKMIYARHLAVLLQDNVLDLAALQTMDDVAVTQTLMQVKGIGHWTADVYLMMCLQRSNCFPVGDIALVNSMKTEFNLPKETTREALLDKAQQWAPNRTIAAYLLWHAYLSVRRKKARPHPASA